MWSLFFSHFSSCRLSQRAALYSLIHQPTVQNYLYSTGARDSRVSCWIMLHSHTHTSVSPYTLSLSRCPVFPSPLSSWCPWTVSEQSIWKITETMFPSSTSYVSHRQCWHNSSWRFIRHPGVTEHHCVAGEAGTTTPYMRPVYPTKTFPNHYSIVTVSFFSGVFTQSDVDLLDTNGHTNLFCQWWKNSSLW